MTDWGFAVEGRIDVTGGEIWYGLCGDRSGTKTPLIIIHGGPGMSHDYLYPLRRLADDRAVVFYDQLDAGKSDRPNDPNNWKVERFLDEIDRIRNALDLQTVSVFGNSWGGTLAAAYAARNPQGLKRAVLSSPLINTKQWVQDNAVWRSELPDDVLALMDEHEARGDTGAEAYLDAVDVFYRRHLCRVDPWPDTVMDTFNTLNETCYAGMWGPNEFTCNGVLKDYDGSGQLSAIAVPTLVTCGAFDEATPRSTEKYASLIPCSEFKVFAEASHLAFVEQEEEYLAAVARFLDS